MIKTDALTAGKAAKRRRDIAASIATYALLALVVVITAGPVLLLLAISFTDTILRTVGFAQLADPSLDNYKSLFVDRSMGRWLFNSIVVAAVVTLVTLFLDSLAGYAFAKMRFAGRNVTFVALLATAMVPLAVLILPLFLIAIRLGFLDTLVGLIVPALAFPIGVFMMRQFIDTVPTELLDAARIDGLSDSGIYLRVILPLIIPGIAVLSLFVITVQWNSFLWPTIMSSTDASRTVPVGLASLQGLYTTNWGLVGAGTIVSMIPMMIAVLWLQRYLTRGVVGGRGGKG